MADVSVFFVLFIVILGVLIIWYLSRRMNKIPERKLLNFSDENNHLQPWLDAEIPKNFKVFDPQETAQLFLSKVVNREEEQGYLAIGTNIYENYYRKYEEYPKLEDFYDLRELIGVNCQILICDTRKQAKELLEFDNYSRVIDVLEKPGALDMVTQYLTKVMNWRWEQIHKINPKILRTGSYLYLPETLNGIANVMGKATICGIKYNLLGDEKEFIAFVERMKKNSLLKSVM